MNHIVLIGAIALLPTTTVFAQIASAPLIVVEDRGGDSALPYYQSLNPQPDQATPPAASAAIASHWPGARLVVLADAAHLANIEQAAAFNDAVLDFLTAPAAA